jgi:DtxR family Mn-dependent transcriptional regulator
MSTITKENYLKTIFVQSNIGENAYTSKMAKKLSVSNAAISDMAKKLSLEGLVTYEKYRGMVLTSAGEKIALKVLRRHRLWELFLTKVLRMSWSEVHDEAEKLEHHSSDALIDKIDEFLLYPEFDPHGEPIPKKNGLLPKSPKSIPIIKGEIGNKYQIVRVDDQNRELMNYLTKNDLLLNTKVEIIDRLSFDNSVIVKIKDKKISLSEKISQSVFVKSC